MVLGGLTVVVLVVASVVGIGRYTFERRIDGEIDGLLESGEPAERPPVTEADIARLPDPVQRWLRWSGTVGRPVPSTVRLRQEGELRLGDRGWVPFTAEEYYATASPAFLWKATVSMAPGVPVVGTDSYIDGRGELEMRVLGLIPVAKDSGPAMDEGDLLRYLNEIMWFPAGALIPEITWEAVDDASARATMTFGGVQGTATFFFDAEGRPTNMIADRYDRDHGAVVPWSTPITAYGEFDGIRVPTAGEAVYAREDGDFSYIRLEITDIDYDVPERY